MWLIGHRGAPRMAPENTLASFTAAIEAGVDWVECDIHRCASGELVVIHDDTVDRTTDGTGAVAKLPLRSLKRLDCGQNARIPTLDELIALCHTRVGLNIELKSADAAAPLARSIDTLLQEDRWGQHLIVSSFHWDALETLRAHLRRWRRSSMRVGLLWVGDDEGLSTAVERYHPFSIHAPADAVDAQFVARAHRCGVAFLVWTVNERSDARRLGSLGVDGIFTDDAAALTPRATRPPPRPLP